MTEQDNVELDLQTLCSNGLLLKQEVLRPGDVLLVRGRGPKSQLIAKSTGGPYSHAAIWLPSGYERSDGVLLAEADGAGVGFTKLFPVMLHNPDRSDARGVYCIPGNPSKCILLRHPAIGMMDSSKLHEASRHLQDSEFYKAYSALNRLIPLTKIPQNISAIVASIVEVYDRRVQGEGTRGAFCSELVAMFFAKLNLELFSDNRAPSTIHPNAFLLEACRLIEVPNAFLEPGSLQPGTKGHGFVHQERKDDPSLCALIRNRGQYDRISHAVDQLGALTQRMVERNNEQMRQLGEQTELGFFRRISQAEALGEQERAERLRQFFTLQKYGYRLLQYVDEFNKTYRHGSRRPDDIVPWNDASFALQRIAHKLISEASLEQLRDVCLLNLRVMRAARRERPLDVVKAAKFRLWRIKTIKAWVERKRNCRQVSELTERMLKTDDLGEQALVYVSEVAQATYDSLLKEVGWNEPELATSLLELEGQTDGGAAVVRQLTVCDPVAAVPRQATAIQKPLC